MLAERQLSIKNLQVAIAAQGGVEAFTSGRAGERVGQQGPLGAYAADREHAARAARDAGLPPAGGPGGSAQRVADPPRWVRTDDLRPAAVEAGMRFADHEIVAAHRSRRAQREDAVIGRHGDLGSLLNSMSTTSGSAIVPTLWASDIIDRARNNAAVIKAGATMVPMDSKVVQIGRLTADPTASFRTEGSTITASDPTFDNVTLTATTLSALVVGSLEWFQDAPNVDEVVSEAAVRPSPCSSTSPPCSAV